MGKTRSVLRRSAVYVCYGGATAMCAYLAFYKGPGNWMDRLVRWWTGSVYSHCEVVIDDYWYSASYQDSGVRCKYMAEYKEEHWDFVQVEVNEKKFHELFDKAEGKGYDWLGIFLTEVVPMGIEDRGKWYCSEFCARAVGMSLHVSPGELYTMVL